MTYFAGSCDVAVIGAGHAGIEAALAAARLGLHTILFTINLDAVGNMPCNPAIGGTGKGHLVRELDALGGEMGVAADASCIQYRMLNRGKGPAVHSLRAQADRAKYKLYMKHTLEQQEHLELKQAQITEILTESGAVCGVRTQLGAQYPCRAVIIATGTYLDSTVITGECVIPSGPDGMHPSQGLADCLRSLGLSLRRFKTGTPPRVNRRSIDFSKMELQPGDDTVEPFSFRTEHKVNNSAVCYLTYTNEETHRIIRENLHRSPMYDGTISDVGPRYCPSIETKIVRFADKDRHQVFVEPCGEDTEEMYLQGLSSSLPEDVQNAMYHSIVGFEKLEIMRPAYAIEYDCVDPTALAPTLECKAVQGLYGAGQFNGTSGYEEAAAQGLLAGLNAGRAALGKSQLVLGRHTSYLGTLVDDLVTKGVMDPYRMMTSRSEYRLTLRQDNADERLTPIGREYGLVTDERWAVFQRDMEVKAAELKRLEHTTVKAAELAPLCAAAGVEMGATGGPAAELLRRPGVTYALVAQVIGWGEGVTPMMAQRIETEIKYAGYIARQQRAIREVQRRETVAIPEGFDYSALQGLTLEAREKLARIRPRNLGQAGRIPGVSPADEAVLSLALRQLGR